MVQLPRWTEESEDESQEVLAMLDDDTSIVVVPDDSSPVPSKVKQTSAVLQLLERRPEHTNSKEEIASATGRSSSSLERELKRLLKGGRIEKPGRGKYRLTTRASWLDQFAEARAVMV